MTQNSISDTREKAVDLVLSSPSFARSKLNQDLLRYIAREMSAGRGAEINEYTIAQDIFDRGEHFDPAQDPIVRVRMGRLRAALARANAESPEDVPKLNLPAGQYQLTLSAPSPEPEPGPTKRRQGKGVLVGLVAAALTLAVMIAGLWQVWPAQVTPELPLIRLAAFRTLDKTPRSTALGRALQNAIASDLQRFGYLDVTLGTAGRTAQSPATLDVSGVLLGTDSDVDVLVQVTGPDQRILLERRYQAPSARPIARKISGHLAGPDGAIFALAGHPVLRCQRLVDQIGITLSDVQSPSASATEACDAPDMPTSGPVAQTARAQIVLMDQDAAAAPDAAAQSLADLTRMFPDHARSAALAGLLALQRGEVETALDTLMRARDLNPADAFTHRALSLAYLSAGDLEAAAISAQDALDVAAMPHPSDHLAILIDALARNDHATALTASAAAKNAAPGLSLIHAHLAGRIADKTNILSGLSPGQDPLGGLQPGEKARAILQDALSTSGLR